MENFGFVVVGIPRVPKAQSAQKWKATVAAAAAKVWPPGAQPLDREVGVAIVYFYREGTNIDVDNIGKLIIDGIKGVAIVDDSFVSQVVLRKTDQLSIDSLIEPPDVVASIFGREGNFVYVALTRTPDHRRLPE